MNLNQHEHNVSLSFANGENVEMVIATDFEMSSNDPLLIASQMNTLRQTAYQIIQAGTAGDDLVGVEFTLDSVTPCSGVAEVTNIENNIKLVN